MAPKRFGGRETRKAEEFELETQLSDGTTKIHKFRLTPVLPAGHVVAIMDALNTAPEESVGLLSRLLSRVLDDRDGTPAKWAPPEISDLTDDPEAKPKDVVWTGPDGATYTMSDEAAFAKFQDVTNGSSRRRWKALMDPDNEDEGVMLADLLDIGEWVISRATDRPTRARASSGRTRKTRH